MARFVSDPVRERELEAAAAEQQRRWMLLTRSVTPTQARGLSQMVEAYPSVSPELARALFSIGAAGANADTAALAMREERVRADDERAGVFGFLDRWLARPLLAARDWGFNAAKATVRTAALVAEGAWEEMISRPYRTLAGVTQGQGGFGEMWQQAGESDLAAAAHQRFSGQQVNIGSGWIPQSDKPEESERFQQLVGQGVDPDEAYEQVAQEMGVPVTQIARQQRETGITFQGQPVSPGRQIATVVFEPGTTPYNLLSGLCDMSVRLALDPTAKTLRGISAARRGARLISVPTAAQEVGTPASRLAINFARGLIPGVRKTVHGQSVENFLVSKDGRRVAEWIANTNGDDAFVLIREALQGRNPTPLPARLIADLVDAKDPTAVLDLLRPHLGPTLATKPVHASLASELGLPSLSRGLGRGLGRLIGSDPSPLGGFGVTVKHAISGTRLGRLFEKMPGISLVFDDIDTGLAQLDEYLIAVGWSASRRSKYLGEYALLRKGDGTGAYAIMKRVMRDVEDDLVKPRLDAAGNILRDAAGNELYDGIPRILARRVTRMFKEQEDMREFMHGSNWFIGDEMVALPNGQRVMMSNAGRIDELLQRAIPLPDIRQLRRAASEIDRMHRIVIGTTRGVFRTVTGKEGGFTGAMREAMGKTGDLSAVEAGTLEHIMDFYMHKIWKPMVLLRVAWPVRVCGEEQLRLGGAGLDSLLTHPFSYIAWLLGSGEAKGRGLLAEAARKYGRGATGVMEEGADDFVALRMSQWHKDSMSRGAGGWIDERGDTVVRTAGRTRKGYATYRLGDTTKRKYLDVWGERIVRHADDPVDRALASQPFDEVERSFWDGRLKWYRDEIAGGSAQKTTRLNTREGARIYLQQAYGQMVEDAGGRTVAWLRGQKGVTSFDPLKHAWTDVEYEYLGGNAHLLDAFGTGELAGVKVRGISSPAQVAELRRTLGADLYYANAPATLSGPILLDAGKKSAYDRALDTVFTYAMSKVTNFVNRSPAARQFYWQRVEELMPFMDAPTLNKALRAARTAKLGRGTLRRMDGLTPAAKGTANTLTSMKDVETLAGGFAMFNTKQLLYDLTTRHRVTDMLRNVFPFGEAFLEIFSTWGRLMYRNPAILRRFQQTVAGARGSGFFYTDPMTGKEVFAYPGGGLLAKWMFGQDGGTSLKLQGMVQGLNLVAGSVLPGFGPIIQIPTSLILPHTPDADGLRKLILPFGDAEIDSPGSIIDAALPAYFKKIIQAFSDPNAGGDLARLQAGTSIEVLRALLLTGQYNLDTPEDAERAVKAAATKARNLTLIRGFAQFFLPSGPTVAFQAEDRQGNLHFFQALSSDYYDKVQNTFDGDEDEALAWFISTYGINPYDIVTPKTQRVYKRHTTSVGDRWARDNEDLFTPSAYPITAYHAMPDDPRDEFDYPAYIRQLAEGTRVPYSLEQWAVVRNQTLGRIQYQRAKNLVGSRTDVYARQYLAQKRAWLATQYPGYGMPNVGTVVTPDAPMTMAELLRWADEPRLANSDAGQGLAVYLRWVQWAERTSQAAGLSPNGYKTAERMRPIRLMLRQQAERIMVRNPDFAGIWKYILSPQLDADEFVGASETADTLLDRLTGGSI